MFSVKWLCVVLAFSSYFVTLKSQEVPERKHEEWRDSVEVYESVTKTPNDPGVLELKDIFTYGGGEITASSSKVSAQSRRRKEQRRRSGRRRKSKSRRRSSRRRRRRRKSDSPRRRSKDPTTRRRSSPDEGNGDGRRRKEPTEMISDVEWKLFELTRWRHLHFDGHFCAAQIQVYPPRCFKNGDVSCIAGEPRCDKSRDSCRKSTLNSIAFDCRLWRAARKWYSQENEGKTGFDKIVAEGIYDELKHTYSRHDPEKKTSIFDMKRLMGVYHKDHFKVNECCGACSGGDPMLAFKHIISTGWRPGDTTMCMRTGNPLWNVTRLSAVANVNGCFVQLFSSDSFLPNPTNLNDYMGKLPIETIDQSCIPDKYKDEPQLPPLCSGKKEDIYDCKRRPGPTPAPWTPGFHAPR